MVNLRNGVSVALINNFFLSTNIIMPIQHISINSIIHSNKISSNKPYVFISNERNPENDLESLGDGSLISINGCIQCV